MKQEDEIFIKRCFELAEEGKGNVSPNPLVGCVIVKNGKIISEGRHEEYGMPHAEANAIEKASENLEGSTLYCNLEPCCHTNKKTPPCTPRIIENKIHRVVISNVDPNPFVSGKGIEQLRNSGIEVETGILEEGGKYLNRFFFKYIKTGLPYVTLKIAQSADGKITSEEGKQTWITGEESAKYVHSLRAEYDAVLVGANTIKVDDPQLNIRHCKGRDPLRIIVDGMLTSPIAAKVYSDSKRGNTIIFTSRQADRNKISLLRDRGIKIIEPGTTQESNISLNELLFIAGTEKITSVLVEGGSRIFTQFIKEDLFDELIILQSKNILGKGIDAFNAKFPENLRKINEEMLGEDKKNVYLKLSE